MLLWGRHSCLPFTGDLHTHVKGNRRQQSEPDSANLSTPKEKKNGRQECLPHRVNEKAPDVSSDLDRIGGFFRHAIKSRTTGASWSIRSLDNLLAVRVWLVRPVLVDRLWAKAERG